MWAPSVQPTGGPTVTPDFGVTIEVIEQGTGTFQLTDVSTDDADSMCNAYTNESTGAEPDNFRGLVCPQIIPKDTPKTFIITETPPGQICRLFGPNPTEYGPTVECLDDSSQRIVCTTVNPMEGLKGEVSYIQTGHVTLWARCYGMTSSLCLWRNWCCWILRRLSDCFSRMWRRNFDAIWRLLSF